MTHEHDGGSPLATSTRRRCHACGQPMPPPLLHDAADEGLCPPCWLRSRWWRLEGDERQRVFEALADRMRIGQRLGNGRRVAYPADLDGDLICRLETMRRYLVRVEVTVASDRFDEEHRVIGGHLRRYVPVDTEMRDFQFDFDLIGLFQNVGDREPITVLGDEDFERIVQVELIDPLLLCSHDPVVVWVASPEQVAGHAARRGASLIRECCRARWFLIHVALVLVIWVGLLVPTVIALASREWWKALGGGFSFAVVGFFTAMTLAVWEPTPDLSTLRTAGNRRT